jgi:hypothetical protein
MNHRPRIEMTDTTMDAMIKMAEGNPGAITAIMKLMESAETVDPQSALGGVGALLSLDTHGIYGSNIWILYKDVCGMDVRKVLMLLRAVQLGYLPESRLVNARKPFTAEEIADLDAKVCERLEQFQKAA